MINIKLSHISLNVNGFDIVALSQESRIQLYWVHKDKPKTKLLNGIYKNKSFKHF